MDLLLLVEVFTTKRLLNALAMMATPTATGIALIVMVDSARGAKVAVIVVGTVAGLLLLWAASRVT